MIFFAPIEVKGDFFEILGEKMINFDTFFPSYGIFFVCMRRGSNSGKSGKVNKELPSRVAASCPSVGHSTAAFYWLRLPLSS